MLLDSRRKDKVLDWVVASITRVWAYNVVKWTINRHMKCSTTEGKVWPFTSLSTTPWRRGGVPPHTLKVDTTRWRWLVAFCVLTFFTVFIPEEELLALIVYEAKVGPKHDLHPKILFALLGIKLWFVTEEASLEEVTLSAFIREVRSSILGRYTGYPDKIFPGFSQKNSSISSRSRLLKSIPMNY
jgi:hypothetical protein